MTRRRSNWWRWLSWRHRRDAVALDLEEEIRLHLELRTEQLMERGLSRERARAEAEQRFGALERVRPSLRRAALRRERGRRFRGFLDGLRQDLGYALRRLAREPGFALVVVLTMALGIGANAAMFGVVDRLLLRGPEHVWHPDQLVRFLVTVARDVRGSDPQIGASSREYTQGTLGYVAYTIFRDNTRSFQGVAAYSETDATAGRGTSAERIRLGSATVDFFPLLGVRPLLGRFFAAAEDRPPAGEHVVVLGYGLWQRRFAGAPDVIGRTLVLGDVPFTVIGVAPAGFTGVELREVDAWQPMTVRSHGITQDWPTAWDAQWLHVVARVKPGVTATQAGADATAAFRHGYTGTSRLIQSARVSVAPLRYNGRGQEPLEVAVSRWLVGVALVVLLIACANVINLYLARAERRRREVAVRLAMGISRGRLVRLLLVEGMVLAVVGGGAALLLAYLAGSLLRGVLLPDVQWVASPVNVRVLGFTAAVALATGAVTSLLPAVHASRPDLTTALRTGVREGGGRRQRLRAALCVAQAALSLVLLVGAGLFVRSLSNVQHLHLGIEPDRVLALSFRWSGMSGFSHEEAKARRTATYQRALERIRTLPGISAASIAIGTPFRSAFTVRLRVPGWDSIPAMSGGGPYVSAVTSGYFATVGTNLLRGRVFTEADGAGSEPVAIVSQTMAHTLWPGEGALGQCIYVGRADDGVPCSTVVGVVEDARRFGLREDPAMQYYIPVGQERGFGGENLLVRPRGDLQAAVATLRAEVERIDPAVYYTDARSLQDELDPQIRPWRLGAAMFGLFGLLALLIAAVGLYSVIAYTVARRTQELGVRMALGARAGSILGMVVRETVALAAGGLLIGALIALATGGFLAPILFNVSPRDPLVLGSVAGTLLGVAVLAGLLPAHRAARVDPVRALRSE